MLGTVKRVIDRRGPAAAYHECRRCGTGFDRARQTCVACGSADIATYDL